MRLLTFPETLRTGAALACIASATFAYPAAAELLGENKGMVLVALVDFVIFACWHYVGTEKGTDDMSWGLRAVVAIFGIAGSLIAFAGAGISAEQRMNNAAEATAKASDATYNRQEKIREETLAAYREKLLATDNRKDPNDYKELVTLVDKYSVPTVRQPTATETTKQPIPKKYVWAVAGTVQVSIIALLLLAGLFDRRAKNSCSAVVIDEKQLNKNPVTTDNNPDDPDPMEVFTDKSVETNHEGAVVAQAVANFLGIAPAKARDVMKQAVAEGYLYTTGQGNSTRYWYWDAPKLEQETLTLRRVK